MPILPSIDSMSGRKVIDDAVRAFKAQPNVAAGLGAATREAIVGPVSYGMEAVSNAVAPAARTTGQFFTGLTGGQPTTAAPAAPVPRQTIGGVIGGSSTTAPAASPAPMLASAPAAQVRAAVNPAAYAPTQYSPTPSLQPIPEEDPNAAIMKALNSGTWSGMMNARTLARRRDQDRAAAVQATQAETGRIGAESSRLGAMASVANASTSAARAANDARLTDVQLAGEKQKQELTAIELADRQEMENLRRLAAQGDEKALARYRSVMAAKAGKDPTTQTNEKLLDAYIKSVGEFSKDPANMGKPAPTFQDFAAGLPRGMFPTVEKYVGGGLPPGAVKQVGTSGGRPVYQMRDGSQMISTIGVRG